MVSSLHHKDGMRQVRSYSPNSMSRNYTCAKKRDHTANDLNQYTRITENDVEFTLTFDADDNQPRIKESVTIVRGNDRNPGLCVKTGTKKNGGKLGPQPSAHWPLLRQVL